MLRLAKKRKRGGSVRIPAGNLKKGGKLPRGNSNTGRNKGVFAKRTRQFEKGGRLPSVGKNPFKNATRIKDLKPKILVKRKKGGSMSLPGGRLKRKRKSRGGSVTLPGGKLRRKSRGGSVTLPGGKLRHVPAFKHGASFVGGGLSQHDSMQVFHGPKNSYYPALDRSNLRNINYRGVKHMAYSGSVI